MHYPSFVEAIAGLPPNAPVIGLDLGSKTIGVAISDITLQIASPIETIARKKFTADAKRLLAIAAERQAGLFVLGLPLNMDGSEGPRAQSTRAFARNLGRLTQLPIVFWDERLTTAAVERMLIDADTSRARRAEIVDKLAATYILQSALDSLKR
jgi:putative pre-16S rRNA nuclease